MGWEVSRDIPGRGSSLCESPEASVNAAERLVPTAKRLEGSWTTGHY